MPTVRTAVIHGQPSWRFSSDRVTAAVTRRGGHLAPVTYRLGSKKVTPFSLAPWAKESLAKNTPPVLRVLRGDFFCAPFGADRSTGRGKKHPLHGETANAPWRFVHLRRDREGVRLHLSLRTKARLGQVDKLISLKNGQPVIYCRHVLSGMRGKMTLGHHAMLKFPDEEGCGRISTSRFRVGWTFPGTFEDPSHRGYSALKPSAVFQRLDRVPLAQGGHTDLSRYPARRGFEDLVQIAHQDTANFAWMAVAFPREGYAWFSLKDPRVLPTTILWISNGGRHYPPWNGRHVNVMGLEDVNSFFPLGIAPAEKPNPINRTGCKTVATLTPEKPTLVNYIMAVAAIPRGFSLVQKIVPTSTGVTLVSPARHRVSVKLDLPFLHQGNS